MTQFTEFLKTVTLPQAAIVLGLVAGGVAIAYRIPNETLVEVVTSIVIALGVGGTLLTSRRKPERITSRRKPERITDPGPEAPAPRRNPRDGSCDFWDLVAWCVVAAGLFLAFHASGCGAASAEVRTAYAVEQAHCISNERAIVDRAGTTEEQDRADLAAERARCDAALMSIYGGP